MRQVRPLALGLGLWAVFGCGGVWDQAMGDAVVEQVGEMRVLVSPVTDGPEKQSVNAMLDAVEGASHSGAIGVMEIAMFRAEIEQSVADGTIEAGELNGIQKAYDDMMRP